MVRFAPVVTCRRLVTRLHISILEKQSAGTLLSGLLEYKTKNAYLATSVQDWTKVMQD